MTHRCTICGHPPCLDTVADADFSNWLRGRADAYGLVADWVERIIKDLQPR